jgi:hypothetical protein
MIPRTFPSTYASNGQQQMVVHFLTSVAGLARWSDYIPVKLVQGGPENSYSGTIDVAVIPTLTADTQAWKEYIPVYVDDAGTDAWTVNAVGYIPYNYALFTDASMQLDLTNGGELDPRVTFTRTSNATVTDSTGTLVYAPHNLLTFSESFDNAVWTKESCTVSANSAVAPDGTSTADKLVENTATAIHYINNSGSVFPASTAISGSFYAKAGERTTVACYLIDSGIITSTTTVFDLSAGTVISGASGQIEDAGNGWYRCSVNASATTSTTTSARLRIFLQSSSSYTGDGTSGIFIWGAQLNVGSLQPYYPTTRKNLLGFTQEFDNAAWTKSNATVTANATAAPDGSVTADELVENTAAGIRSLHQTLTTVSSTTYSLSAFAKETSGSKRYLRLAISSTASVTLWAAASFDLETQLITTNAAGGGTVTTTSIVPVGNGWYRCTLTGNIGANADMFAIVAVVENASVFTGSGRGRQSYTGDGTSGLFIWGAQLSDSASLDPYVYNPGAAPASTAYFGPRFDYNPVTLAPKGLLIEEQRTNLLLRSEEFETTWTNNNSTEQTNVVIAPSGSLVGDKLIEDTTASVAHRIASGLVLSSSGTWTASVYIKAAERSFAFIGVTDNITGAIERRVNLSTGVIDSTNVSTVGSWTSISGSSTSVGNGWWRVSVTGTQGAGTLLSVFVSIGDASGNRIYTGDGTSGIYIWGAQLEAGAFATSYIPTTTAAATRAADAASMTGANFSNWYNAVEGTLFVDASPQASNALSYALFEVNDATALNRIGLFKLGTNGNASMAVLVGGVVQASTNNGAWTASGKLAGAYAVNDFASVLNGGAASTDTSGTLPLVTQATIAARGDGGSRLTGTIKRIAYYPRKLSSSELQGITS